MLSSTPIEQRSFTSAITSDTAAAAYIGAMIQHERLDVGPARESEVPSVRGLLRASGLPDAGIDAIGETLVVAREGGEVVGCAALELYRPSALLRSVAVDQDWRGSGLGIVLTRAALDLARELGVQRVYLLTETAAGFFPRFGFRPVSRTDIELDVLASEEFTLLCPDTAQAMVLDLDDG
jgi:amino-acid N-acetyltransferase